MKKMKVALYSLVGLLAVLVLVACQKASPPSDTTDWLVGKWHSKDWDTTYTFAEEAGKWTIHKEDTVLAEEATLVVEDNLYTLTDEDGVSHIIEQQGTQEMVYQQVAPEGKLGTTDLVTFEKVD